MALSLSFRAAILAALASLECGAGAKQAGASHLKAKATIAANRGYNPLVQGDLVFFFVAEGVADKDDEDAEHAAEEGGDDAD